MSWNGPPLTFLGHPSDQSLHSAMLAAAGPNPPSFPPDEEENKGESGEGRTEERGRGRRKGGRGRSGGRRGGGGGCAIVSCLMKVPDLPQTDRLAPFT